MDKTTPAYWQAIKPKSIITISDAQGIQDSMRRGLGVRGIDYAVSSIVQCDHCQGLSTHLIFTLEDTEQDAYLVAKMVDDSVDLFLYFEPSGFTAGSRPELLNQGMHWLFQAPANPDDFDPAELRYTTSISQTKPASGGDPSVELLYALKGQGELQCHHSETPVRAGLPARMLATLVEYHCDQPNDNPEFLILEVGEERSSRSFVRFFLGCALAPTEVDVLGV